MISYLQWKLIELNFHDITILTSGWVGYWVVINELIYAQLTQEQEVEMFIYHHKTENSEMLFGFLEKNDKQVFSELIKISWVGGKIAMQILSLWIHRLIWAIHSADHKTIESIKWIGKKMAEKIILELKDKDFNIGRELWENKKQHMSHISWDLFESIKDTLVNMWYQSKYIEKALNSLPDGMKNAEEIIPYLIKELS